MNRVEELFENYRAGRAQYVRNLKGVQEENEILEFKRLRSNRLPLHDNDKKNIAETISAFANSAGGILVLGVDARMSEPNGADVVQEFYPITGLKAIETTLLSVVPQITQGGQIAIDYEILEEDTDTGFVVMYIEASEGEPVRATATGTHQYYIRNGATNLIMSHSQLSDMFGKRPKPKLGITWKIEIEDRTEKYTFVFGLQNSGRAIAMYPAIRFHLRNGIEGVNLLSFDVPSNGPFIRETSDYPHSILYRGRADQFIHINSTAWFARYRTIYSYQTEVSRDFIFDIDLLCDGIFLHNSLVITAEEFNKRREQI